MTKEARTYNGEKTASSISGAGKTGQLHVRTLPNTIQKNKLQMDLRPDTIKLLEENIGKTLFDINHNKILFDPPHRVMEIKINKWYLIKLKSFCTANEIINKAKMTTLRMGENICK